MMMMYRKLKKQRLYSISCPGVLEYEDDDEDDNVQPWFAQMGAFLFYNIFLLLILLIVLVIVYVHCKF